MSLNTAPLQPQQIALWARELGFQQTGITDTELTEAEQYLFDWLDKGYHGEMTWMARHGHKRSRPQELVAGTIRVISVRMDYWVDNTDAAWSILHDSHRAYVSRYALGRDYHKLLRQRLQSLAERIANHVGEFGYRVFVDSAPVLEKPLAQKAGLGWMGKHTNLIHRAAGSYFFLGEIYTDLPLAVTPAHTENHCGRCQACIDICPTQAIIAPYQLDARRCISYLTIEHPGAIDEALRPLIGNRIYGCDDCQLICPWNRFAQTSRESDFHPRHRLDDISLLALFDWNETAFLKNTEGSAIRRIGHERWLRNIAVALGNAKPAPDIVQALQDKLSHPSPVVREHIQWALTKQRG